MMQALTDAELVDQVQTGNREAMSTLYRRHRPAVFRYALSKLYDQQQAQDITGEIFLRVVTHLPQYEVTGAPFTSWLFRIAHNAIISHRQKENAKQLVPLVQAHSNGREEDNPARVVEQKLEMEWVRRGLERLEENQREVIILRFLIGLSLKETAHAVDKSVGAVKTLQHRGILALRAVVHIT